MLIEAIIAFSIALIILSVGSTLIYSFLQVQQKATVQFQEALYKRALTTRLRAFVGSLQVSKGKKPLLVSHDTGKYGERLLFMGDNGIYRSPLFANSVLYYLFVDEEGLKVALHTDPERKKMDQDKEVVYLIWPNATKVSFRFFGAKNLSKQSVEWSKDWDDKEPPLAVETTIESKERQNVVITSLVVSALTELKPLKAEITKEQLQGLVSSTTQDTDEEDEEEKR